MGSSWWWRLAAVALLPLLLVPGGLHVLARLAIDEPGAVCIRCHAMQGPHDEWSRSTHRGASCASCHAPAAGALARETAVLGLLARCLRDELRGAPRLARVPSATCLTCHSSFYQVRQVSAARHVPHPHGECTSCHQGLVHRRYDRDALAVAVAAAGPSLFVDADFPRRLPEQIGSRRHFQHGFAASMAFCGACHRMAAERATGVGGPRSPVCENCHIRY